MRIGSLFTGYGGLDMAVREMFGGEVAWHVENEPAAARVLAHHWPHVDNLGDATEVNWNDVKRAGGDANGSLAGIDVLTGGFPCQDVSTAGRRAGLRPNSRSGLWAHMARAVYVLRPELVIVENVRGLLNAETDRDLEPCPWCVGDGKHRPLRALGAVLGDLATLGYDTRWCGLRAADVGAPHGRFRVFLLANRLASADPASDRWHQGRTKSGGQQWRSDASFGGRDVAAWGEYAPAIQRWERILGRLAPNPTQPGRRTENPQLSPAFVEWMMGLPAGHVTNVEGLSRNDQLRLLGNGVVPQQATTAVRWLLRQETP